MLRPEAATLLHAWERGAAQGPTMRGLLLLALAHPQATAAELAATGIGRRDSLLLDLRELLFGRDLECVAHCAHCGEYIEISFPVVGIRAGHGGAEDFEIEADGCRASFRLPSCGDLLALAGERDASIAERALLRRCLISLSVPGTVEVGPAEVPACLVAAIDARMAELDSQARVELEIRCGVCDHTARAPFDIVTHLWNELDAWAHRLLREVHAIACTYGWNESQVLALSNARRRIYLEFIEGVP